MRLKVGKERDWEDEYREVYLAKNTAKVMSSNVSIQNGATDTESDTESDTGSDTGDTESIFHSVNKH